MRERWKWWALSPTILYWMWNALIRLQNPSCLPKLNNFSKCFRTESSVKRFYNLIFDRTETIKPIIKCGMVDGGSCDWMEIVGNVCECVRRKRTSRRWMNEWMSGWMSGEDFGLNDDNIISLYPSIRTSHTDSHKYKIYDVKNDE